jgi:hypothetical protein
LKPKHFALLGILVLLLCLPVNSVYALDQGNAVLNGIGDLILGFITFIIEAIVNAFFAILDFFANLIFGV